MQIRVTQKGSTTRLSKRELSQLTQVHELLGCLATNRPMVSEYAEARESVGRVLAIFREANGPGAYADVRGD